jgi:nitrogen regulatory protein P-II 1
MFRITAFIRPHRLEQVKSAVAALGVSGMNVADVRGTGNSQETAQWFAGEGQVIALPIRARIEVVVNDDLRDSVVDAIVENARTGEPGDGKLFVEEVADALRVRTGERGVSAV